MKPSKKQYKEENELIDEFCNRSKCHSCYGSDDTGEPNGYGCEEMEEFLNDNYHLTKQEIKKVH